MKPIIFLAFANDLSRSLGTDSEHDLISQALKDFPQVQRLTVSKESLRLVFQENSNSLQIFHFGGHGQKNALYLSEYQNNDLAADFFVELLSQYPIKLAVLNACNSFEIAEKLQEKGISAIGTLGEIQDEKALRFAQSFYGHLAQGNTLQEAFERAKTVAQTENKWQLFAVNKNWKLEIQAEPKQNGKKQLERLLTTPPFQAPLFIGREEELKTVHDRLFAGENFLMLVNGQGGIGKTTFAAKYWAKYEAEYSHLAFLFVENGIANGLLSLAPELGLQFTTETTQQQLEILIKTVSNLTKPCLLILDNANNEKDLNENIVWLRKCPNFHILLTSRLADFSYAQKYPLGTLDKPQALKLFKRHYELLQDSEIPLFEEIYEAVDGNTLVLEILAKNCMAFGEPEPEYPLQKLFEDLQKSLLALSKSKEIEVYQEDKTKPNQLVSGKPEHIILAMYNLTELTENEKVVLSIFSVLPAENIALDTLKVLIDYENLKASLVSLHRKGWIEKNTTEGKISYKISPVVQEIVRHKNQTRLFADCEIFFNNLSIKIREEKILSTKISYLPYIESIVKILPKNYYLKHLALLNRIGLLFKSIQHSVKARTIFEDLIELSIDNEALYTLKSNLGQTLIDMKEFSEGEKLIKEAYFFFQKEYGFNDARTIREYINLGALYHLNQKFEKGESIFEEILKLDLNPKPALLAQRKDNLALFKIELKKYDEAKILLDEALHFFQKIEIREDKEAFVLFKFGRLYEEQGNLTLALDCFQRVEIVFQKYYDKTSPNMQRVQKKIKEIFSKINH